MTPMASGSPEIRMQISPTQRVSIVSRDQRVAHLALRKDATGEYLKKNFGNWTLKGEFGGDPTDRRGPA